MIERNERCPCGSGAKFKNCFMKELDSCALFQKQKKQTLEQEHTQKDQLVFRFFREAMEDIGTVFVKNDTKQELVALRVQAGTVFTFVDIVASYWFEYLGAPSVTQKQRFVAWMDEFCFTEKNAEYHDSVFTKVSSERLYDFRSSMVHFFGLAMPANNHSFALVVNDMPEEEWKSMQKKFEKAGKPVTIIGTKKLHNWVLEGAILMLNGWTDIINKAQTNDKMKFGHIVGIDRIYRKIMMEGAVKVGRTNTADNA